jgi:hypothetical protein
LAFYKKLFAFGATQEFYFQTSDAGFPSPVFTRNGYYLTTNLVNIRDFVSGIPYAIEEIKAEILYNTGSGQNYTELITLPYWESGGGGKYWDSSKFGWFPPFWTYWNATVHTGSSFFNYLLSFSYASYYYQSFMVAI